MSWQPEPVPRSLEELLAYLEREFQRLAGELQSGIEAIILPELHVEPSKPREGMVVLADGSDWDPGSGAGYYGYRGGAWHFLG